MMDSDREEILSFSNLEFYSDDDDLQMDSKPFSTENQNSIISSPTASFSGFFCEEWSITTTTPAEEAIIFCGKVIHTTSRNTQNPINNNNNPNNKTDLKNKKKKISSSLSRCKSDSYCKGSNYDSYSGRKKNDSYKNDLRKPKLACSSKSRWQVFMFGSGRRFPTKMDLSDIKSRQQLRSKMSEEKGGEKRLTMGMGLIRILGCGGGFKSDDTIKTSFGYLHSFDR